MGNFLIASPQYFNVHGGVLEESSVCGNGAGGSLYIQYGGFPMVVVVYTDNGNYSTNAVTIMDRLPTVDYLLAYEMSKIAVTNSLRLAKNTSCLDVPPYIDFNISSPTGCSLLLLNASHLLSFSDGFDMLASSSPTNGSCSIFASKIYMDYSSVIRAYGNYSSLSISVTNFTAAVGTAILFSDQLEIASTFISMYGTIQQLPVGNFEVEDTVTGYYYNYSLAKIYANQSAEFNEIIVTNTHVFGDSISLNKYGSIRSPEPFVGGCMTGLSLKDFNCSDGRYIGNLKYGNVALLIANKSVTVSSRASIEASASLLCANTVYIKSLSTVHSDGLGCYGGEGPGAGSISSGLGGGGGAYGGAGGKGIRHYFLFLFELLLLLLPLKVTVLLLMGVLITHQTISCLQVAEVGYNLMATKIVEVVVSLQLSD